MQHMKIGPWEIEYDREATRAAYAAMDSDGYCDCQGCRNYYANAFPAEVQQFFDSLGVDPAKPSKLDGAIATGEDDYLYGGWYHIVGRYISGQDWWYSVPMTPEEIEQVPFRSQNKNTQYSRIVRVPHDLLENFSVGFTRKLVFVPKEIPEEQALQLEFSASLPWLLDEPKEECYLYKGD